jgi:hypothetical protein
MAAGRANREVVRVVVHRERLEVDAGPRLRFDLCAGEIGPRLRRFTRVHIRSCLFGEAAMIVMR